jgi:hypothetical protein
MVRSEGNMSLKNPVTQPGIDPGTVRRLAQRTTSNALYKLLLMSSFSLICYEMPKDIFYEI